MPKRLPKKLMQSIEDASSDPLEARTTIMRPQMISILDPKVPLERTPNMNWPAELIRDLHPVTYQKSREWLLSLASDEIPSIDALAIHLGMSRNRLDSMRSSNGDLDEICNIIDTAARERLRIVALQGGVVPQIAALVLKHLGYVDRVDITSKGEAMNAPPLTDEQRALLSVPPAI